MCTFVHNKDNITFFTDDISVLAAILDLIEMEISPSVITSP